MDQAGRCETVWHGGPVKWHEEQIPEEVLKGVAEDSKSTREIELQD
jgi:hypothetical protein